MISGEIEQGGALFQKGTIQLLFFYIFLDGEGRNGHISAVEFYPAGNEEYNLCLQANFFSKSQTGQI